LGTPVKTSFGFYLFLLALPFLGGCCYLADWMGCYPEAKLVSLDWRTPEATFRTFRQAVLFDQVDTIYLCLSQDFKKRNNLDNLAAHLAWRRLQESFPFLRSLFRARITNRKDLPGGRHVLTLEAAGRKFQVLFKPEPNVEILEREEGSGGRILAETVLDDDLPGGIPSVLLVRPDGALVCMLDRPDWKEDLKGLDPGKIASFTVSVDWKIDGISGIEP